MAVRPHRALELPSPSRFERESRSFVVVSWLDGPLFTSSKKWNRLSASRRETAFSPFGCGILLLIEKGPQRRALLDAFTLPALCEALGWVRALFATFESASHTLVARTLPPSRLHTLPLAEQRLRRRKAQAQAVPERRLGAQEDPLVAPASACSGEHHLRRETCGSGPGRQLGRRALSRKPSQASRRAWESLSSFSRCPTS